MGHLLLTKNRPLHNRLILRRAIAHPFFFGSFTMTIFLFFLIVTMGLAYLMNFNQVATKGYELKRLEVQREHLVSQDEVANLKLSEARSLATIEKSPIVARMVKAKKPVYVLGESQLAQR